MNPDTLKLGGLFVGAACCVASFFLPAAAGVAGQVAVFGVGTGILGWVGVRRPGDEPPPPATKPDPK